jgi:hypothetical protein
MPFFHCLVEETYATTYIIEADSEEQAESRAKDLAINRSQSFGTENCYREVSAVKLQDHQMDGAHDAPGVYKQSHFN